MAAQNVMSLTDEEMNIILLLRQCRPPTRHAVYTILNNTNQRNNNANNNNNINSNNNYSNSYNLQNDTDNDLEIALQLQSEEAHAHDAQAPHHISSPQTEEQDRNIAIQIQHDEEKEQDFDPVLVRNMLNLGMNIDEIFPQRSVIDDLPQQHLLRQPSLASQGRRRSEPMLADRERNKCTICLGPYLVHEERRVLQCMHVFHKDCIDVWTNQHRTCPICRTNV